MFKNNKENNNYKNKEEVEKIYEYFKKNFDAKIDEQQSKISELADIVSARFGEDIICSNVNATIKILANNIKDVEKMYKIDLEATEKLLKKEIEKSGEKINKDVEKSIQEQITIYNTINKILSQNGKEIEEVNELLNQKDSKIFELSNELKVFIDGDLEYKKDVEDRFENINKKINKINYLGITSKFDKKLKDESEELNSKIKALNVISQENADFIENLAKKVLDINKCVATDMADYKKDIDKVNEEINPIKASQIKIQEILDNNEKTFKEVQTKLEETLNANNLKVSEEISTIKGVVESNKTEIFKLIEKRQKDLDKKLKPNNEENSKVKEYLLQEIKPIKEEQTKLEESLNANNLKVSEEISTIKGVVESNKTELFKLIEKGQKDLDKKLKVNEVNFHNIKDEVVKEINIIKEKQNELSNNKKIEEELTNLKNIQKNYEDSIKKIDSKIVAEIEIVNEGIKANKNIIKEINKVVKTNIENISKELEDSKQKIDISSNENNKNINSKLENITQKLENSKIEIDKLKSNFIVDLEQAKKSIISDNKKFERHLTEQISINDNENKEKYKKIDETIENMKNSINTTIKEISNDIVKLKEETTANLENQSNEEDIEQLKKEHEEYVLKVNNELDRINNLIINAQKKNLEANNNLQLKIKTYIDNKIEKVNDAANIEELINKLQLSMLEREKLQKIEMEKLLNKKLKEIEKENERILKKKIEELNNYFITNNTMFREEKQETLPRTKKNMYELIETAQTLKRSAASKKSRDNTNEGKSQILKFFYDDDDVN